VTGKPLSWRREFTGDMAGLVDACGWIEELSTSNGLSDESANAIQVCFEEMASNVVRHSGEGLWEDPGKKDNKQSTAITMKVDLTIEADVVRLRLEDNGKPFDVAAAPTQGAGHPVADMAVGGLGLHLVKTMASGVSYRRTDFGNQVNLEFSRLAMLEQTQL
jgi:anti-sigma regulatory factor (Ser/Thr protein kinase)